MKKFNKALASTLAVLSAASALCVPMGVSAVSADTDSGLYIRTADVPDDVISYARDMFSHFTYNDMTNLGFSENEATNMKLSKPFTVSSVGSQPDTYTQYYFPVLSSEDISAMLTVNVKADDNSMSYQFGEDKLSIALDNYATSEDNPVEICMGDSCCFAVDSNNDTDILYTYFDVPEATVDIETHDNTEFENEMSIISISENNVYDDTLKQNTSRSYVGIQLSVPYVNNYSYTGTDGKKHGTCWASCLGSLASFYANPSTGGSDEDASNVRYAAISKYGYSGDINTVVSGVSYYANVKMTAQYGKYDWSTLKSKISNKCPAYTSWTTTADAAGHAMVLSGYRYENTAPNNASYYGIYVMDPNHGTNMLIPYNGTYSINNNPYTWANTAAK